MILSWKVLKWIKTCDIIIGTLPICSKCKVSLFNTSFKYGRKVWVLFNLLENTWSQRQITKMCNLRGRMISTWMKEQTKGRDTEIIKQQKCRWCEYIRDVDQCCKRTGEWRSRNNKNTKKTPEKMGRWSVEIEKFVGQKWWREVEYKSWKELGKIFV